jgi:hypothetical protein
VNEAGLRPDRAALSENASPGWLLVDVVGHNLDQFAIDDVQDAANPAMIMWTETRPLRPRDEPDVIERSGE